MAYIIVENFKLGLDRRGNQINGENGSLWEGVNVHINRKGEVERRKKFVSTYTLPAGTFGFTSDPHSDGTSSLHVFGSTADPGVPSGVVYTRLQHPDGLAMTGIKAVEPFGGELYVIAEFTGGLLCHFYDGMVVDDWLSGVVRAPMADNDGIAAHLQGIIDASADYGATVATNVVTVTGAANTAFAVETTTLNATGGTDDQTLTANTTQSAVAGSDEVLATGILEIKGGSASAGTNKISALTVNTVSIITSAVDWATSDAVTAANLATEINNTTSSPNYTASADGAVVTISAAAGSGSAPNGFALAATAAGDVILCEGGFRITGGTSSAGVNKVSSIKVSGVEILNAAVDWATSHSATAAAVAAQINNYNSTPEYIALASGETVRIGATAVTSAAPASLALAVTVGGDVTIGGEANIDTTLTPLSGGVAAVSGQPQITTLTVAGTFDVGDKFNASLGGINFGYLGKPSSIADSVVAHKNKLYATKGSVTDFCGVLAPTVWDRDDVDSPGANFIDMASQAQGSQQMLAIQPYQGNLAFFARGAIQIWYVEADEDSNTFLQPLNRTGTVAGKSCLAYGNTDVFYLSSSGVRSIRARDSSNAAFVNDVGTPIDPLVQTHLASLTDAQVSDAKATLEPLEDRYWLAADDRIYVFSYFPGAKISAWTYYDLADDMPLGVDAFAVRYDRLYARSGDAIFLYGGADNATYPDDDEIVATVTLPFLDANTPGTVKNFEAFDASLTGVWNVDVLVNPSNTALKVSVGTVSKTTFPGPAVTFQHSTTHVAPKLTCSKAGAASIQSMVIHYEDPNEAV